MKRLLVLTAAIALSACSSMPSWVPGSGWTTLIDGDKGLENFQRVGDANWRAEGGAIVADKAATGGYLLSKDSYKDFQIKAEFWADPGTNSGIFMRIQDPKKIAAATAYEVNIYDQRPGPEYGTAAIVDFAKVQPHAYKAGGKWNTFEITAKGRQITVVLNGKKTAELNNGLFAEGPITLQHGDGVIKFRKVAIKPL
jgi:hypothetical protein